MKLVILLSASILLLRRVYTEIQPAVDPVGIFLQTNIFGLPVLHAEQSWVFDPDIALRRRKQFVELHGDKGWKLIESFGLGVDGRGEDNLRRQQERDQGHLGALNHWEP